MFRVFLDKHPDFFPPITEHWTQIASQIASQALPQATKKTMSATAQLALRLRINLSSENLTVSLEHMARRTGLFK